MLIKHTHTQKHFVTYLTHIKVIVNVFMINTLIVYEVNVMRELRNLYCRNGRLVEDKSYIKNCKIYIVVVFWGYFWRLESLEVLAS